MPQYEIEIKSLLGSKERAEDILSKLKVERPNIKRTERQGQLNHYFIDGDIQKVFDSLSAHLSDEQQKEFKDIVEKGETFSVRTRKVDNNAPLFVVKASLDEGSSHNTVSRLEFEAQIQDMTLEELDALLIDAGFSYQAKWSREREEYADEDVTVCIDKNAGYGYLAEFEKVVDDESKCDDARKELVALMEKLNVEELSQDRLERMFSFYNKNWPEYYGTDKIFVIE